MSFWCPWEPWGHLGVPNASGVDSEPCGLLPSTLDYLLRAVQFRALPFRVLSLDADHDTTDGASRRQRTALRAVSGQRFALSLPISPPPPIPRSTSPTKNLDVFVVLRLGFRASHLGLRIWGWV